MRTTARLTTIMLNVKETTKDVFTLNKTINSTFSTSREVPTVLRGRDLFYN